MMRWTTTAEARLDEGKATACALGSPSNPTIWLQTGVVALNFVERRPDETENHAQRARNPRVWVYTWRALGLIDAVARSPFLRAVTTAWYRRPTGGEAPQRRAPPPDFDLQDILTVVLERRNIPSGLRWLHVAIERLFVHLQVGIRLPNSTPNIL
jgi:hypothetical protein